MSLKSEIYCSTSDTAKKVTVESEMERLDKRELRREQMKLEQSKIVITTGDDVSDVVWTQEKLDELQRVVDKIKQEEVDFECSPFMQQVVEVSRSVLGVEVVGDTKEERIKHIQQIFDNYATFWDNHIEDYEDNTTKSS